MATEWRILSGLAEEERQRILATTRRRTFGRNEVVYHRGDPADTVHLIVRGRFAVKIVTPLGDTAMLSVLSPGDVFGELAILAADGRRSATVLALEPAETRSLHRGEFDALRLRNPEVGEVLVRTLADQVRRLSELLVEALYVPADKRVLRRVRELAALYDDPPGRDSAVPLTQEELAGLAGTSRATVNRVLRDAERRGEVLLRRGRVTVTDEPALARRAG